MNLWRCRGVGVYAGVFFFAFIQHLSVPERGRDGAVLGAAAIPVDAAKVPADDGKEPVNGFGHLKTVLDSISAVCTNYEVCLYPPAQIFPDKPTYREPPPLEARLRTSYHV